MRIGLVVVLTLAASSLAAAPPLANETEAAAEAVRRLMDGPGTASAAAVVGEDDPELQRVYYDTVSEAALAEVRLSRARLALCLFRAHRSHTRALAPGRARLRALVTCAPGEPRAWAACGSCARPHAVHVRCAHAGHVWCAHAAHVRRAHAVRVRCANVVHVQSARAVHVRCAHAVHVRCAHAVHVWCAPAVRVWCAHEVCTCGAHARACAACT